MFRRIAIAFLAGYWLVLVTATHMPQHHIPHAFDLHDKSLHFVAYGLLAGMAYAMWQWWPNRS
ncbi:MAG TPA: hypothetical protein VIY86_04755, partial [Pirellulaceae bacterium]